MAKWIDRAALWGIAIIAAFFLWMSWSGGQILLSMLATFALIFVLRLLLHRLPERRWVFRQERIRRAQALLNEWALMSDPSRVLQALGCLLPTLTQSESNPPLLIQRLPCARALDANELMSIWRNHIGDTQLTIIVTGPADATAKATASRLKTPEIRLIDSSDLTQALSRLSLEPHDLPKEKKRFPSLQTILYRLIESIHPVRAGLYGMLFVLLYIITHSWMYLVAAFLLISLTAISLITRHLHHSIL